MNQKTSAIYEEKSQNCKQSSEEKELGQVYMTISTFFKCNQVYHNLGMSFSHCIFVIYI